MMTARAIRGLLVPAAVCLVWAQTAQDDAFIGARGRYWAYQKVVRPAVPEVRDPWVSNPIDAFLLDAQHQKQLSPSKPLERAQLIRRLSYDLTGLPPTPADVDAFVIDKSTDAYEKLVDRLIASPQYGERWASKWLDVVPTPTAMSTMAIARTPGATATT
jgi:Protein of unknown function (DUF1549)